MSRRRVRPNPFATKRPPIALSGNRRIEPAQSDRLRGCVIIGRMSLPLLSRLWPIARAALTRLRATIAPLNTLTTNERRDLRTWLRALETFVRRVVLLEALSLAPLDRASSDAHLHGCQQSARLKTRDPRKPTLRLWPRPARPRARIRLLGLPTLVREIWREQHRAMLIARLQSAHAQRRPAHIRLADRIDALESILATPIRAARRLARKLTRALAMKLAMARQAPIPGVDHDIQNDTQHASITGALAYDSS